MAHSTIQNMHRGLVAAQQRTRQMLEQALDASSTAYVTGRRGSGNGQRVLVLGGTGYIGRALVPELAARGYRPVVLSRSAQEDAAFGAADVVVGDVCNGTDLERVLGAGDIDAVITLLSSRRPNDPGECRRVDYTANKHAIELAAKHGIRHLIHVSDYGCYRPELLPQTYKLQIEGELLGSHNGELDFTIVRPTAYYPYLAMYFGEVQQDQPYRIFDHGEWAMYNPISRENLAEFIVNQLFHEVSFGRILPVGGPWNEDNLLTIRSAGEKIFAVLGKEPQWKVTRMKSWERRIRIMRAIGALIPMFRRIAYYLEAAKYWSVVSHFAPAYGNDTFVAYLERLRESGYNPGTFRDRMKAGTELTPTHV